MTLQISKTSTTHIGPFVKRLIIERSAQLTSERGVGDVGAIASQIADGTFINDIREATQWVKDMLVAVRQAPGSERFPTDEDIAQEILFRIESRRASQ